jgi:hypothetical protein
MATLQQIGNAVGKAASAGNLEEARRLSAYQALKAWQAMATPPADPPPAGVRSYGIQATPPAIVGRNSMLDRYGFGPAAHQSAGTQIYRDHPATPAAQPRQNPVDRNATSAWIVKSYPQFADLPLRQAWGLAMQAEKEKRAARNSPATATTQRDWRRARADLGFAAGGPSIDPASAPAAGIVTYGPPSREQPTPVNSPDGSTASFLNAKTLPAAAAGPWMADAHPTDWMDQASAAFTSGVRAVPIAGPWLMDRLEEGKAAFHRVPVETIRAEDGLWEDANPVASTTGTVAGTVLPLAGAGLIPQVGKYLGMTGKLLPRVIYGGASGAGIGALDTYARGGNIGDIAISTGVGGVLGSSLPVAVRGVQKALAPFVPRANIGPAAQQLKETAQALNAAGTGSNAHLVPDATELLVRDFVQTLANEGATAGGRIVDDFDKIQRAVRHLDRLRGQHVSMEQLQHFDRSLQIIASSSDAEEARIGKVLLDQLDAYMAGLPRRAFAGGNGGLAHEALKAGKQSWDHFKRTNAIEHAIFQAGRKGGTDEALRAEFGAILSNPRSAARFSPAELAAIEEFTQGSPAGNMLRELLRSGGRPGTVLDGVGVRFFMDRAARTGAADLRDMVAAGRSPRMPPGWFPPAALGLLTRDRRPEESQ